MRRRLDPEEQALWARVAASVRPLFGRVAPPAIPMPPPPGPNTAAPTAGVDLRTPRPATRSAAPPPPPPPAANTLDASWDRRLARGLVAPDMTLDLHGHTLAAAHAALDQGLARAIAHNARLILIVTGRAPTTDWTGGPRRGAIRAAIGDWLGASRVSDRIAAVRNAHPRHGGAGALYVVLRRAR